MSLLTDHSYLIHKLRLAYPQGENITRVPKITQSKYYTPTKEGEEEQQQQQQQQQQPQYQRPIKQYQETGSILENTKNNYHEHHIIAPPKKNIQTIQSATTKVIPASREALTFEKQPNQQVEHKSRLTQKINEASQNLNTFAPFAKFVSRAIFSFQQCINYGQGMASRSLLWVGMYFAMRDQIIRSGLCEHQRLELI